MNDTILKNTLSIQNDEKITSVMIYTDNSLVWGHVITKEVIRVSTWLRTPSLPQYIYLHEAQILTFNGGKPKPQPFKELHLPSKSILAFHIKPPQCDPPDYDDSEAMRKMEPTTALIGQFRFNGMLRMSLHTNLERYLDVAKEPFTSMYELSIANLYYPSMGVIRAPMALIRNELVTFSPRQN